MKILYFHQYFCTPHGGGAVRSYEFARRWVAAGHEVTVITSSGYDESLKPGRCEIDGIQLRVIGGAYRSSMGFVRRLLAYLTYAVQSSWYAFWSRRYNIVLATSTPLTIAVPALISKLFAKRTVIFEVRDVWPDAAVDAGVLKKGMLYRAARILEMAAYQNCDHIVALSDGMRDRIISKGVSAEKISMLPNCSDVERFDPSQFNRENLRENFAASNDFVLLYVGTINTANDMPFLVECMDALKKGRQIKWWFVGDGNQLNYLQEQILYRKIRNVKLWGKYPKSEIAKFVNAADVGIVSFINQPVYYENSPNKFFDYIAGGLPPIFTRTTWLQPYLKSANAEFVCERNSVEEFVSMINQFVKHPNSWQAASKRVIRLARHEFSRDIVSSRYLQLLTNVAGV